MENYPVKKMWVFKYSMVTSFLFLSLFFIEVAIGEIKTEKQVSTVKNTELVVGIIENRFVATGVIVDVKRTEKKPQRFVMLIKNIESIEDYASHGDEYLDKSVEILSEIGIPSSFRPGLEVSLVLRVSGDERGQYLFLVEVINDDKT